MTGYIDYNYVKPEHKEVNERLIEWARWSMDRFQSQNNPMWRWVKPEPVERDNSTNVLPPVDVNKSLEVQRCMIKLPELHRKLLSWVYITKCTPAKAMRLYAVDKYSLLAETHKARDMVKNNLRKL